MKKKAKYVMLYMALVLGWSLSVYKNISENIAMDKVIIIGVISFIMLSAMFVFMVKKWGR